MTVYHLYGAYYEEIPFMYSCQKCKVFVLVFVDEKTNTTCLIRFVEGTFLYNEYNGTIMFSTYNTQCELDKITHYPKCPDNISGSLWKYMLSIELEEESDYIPFNNYDIVSKTSELLELKIHDISINRYYIELKDIMYDKRYTCQSSIIMLYIYIKDFDPDYGYSESGSLEGEYTYFVQTNIKDTNSNYHNWYTDFVKTVNTIGISNFYYVPMKHFFK